MINNHRVSDFNIYTISSSSNKTFYRQIVSNFFNRLWTQLREIFSSVFSTKPTSMLKRKSEFPRLSLPLHELSFEYNMNHRNRGVALIFNQEFFKNGRCEERTASNLDRDRLCKVLANQLNFDVQVHNDLRYQEIMSVLEKGLKVH